MVAYRANDRRGLVSIADCRCLAQGGYSYRNTDHLQPRACRRQRTSCETYAAELKYTRRVRATRPTKATNIANRTSIHDRPKEADGTRFGDWEMDTIVDSYGHAIVTLTERSTNFILMERLKCGRKAVPTAKVVARLLFPYREFVHTITTDNGCEFAAHLEITRMLSRGGRERGKVYFADSYCSWQKGAIENANKLIRKYIPKKANFDDFSDSKIMKIQKKINRRPREKINFDSPKDRFFKHFY